MVQERHFLRWAELLEFQTDSLVVQALVKQGSDRGSFKPPTFDIGHHGPGVVQKQFMVGGT
jgi:hypothetical protein